MQNSSVKVVMTIFLWALFFCSQCFVEISAASYKTVDSLALVQDAYQKLIAEKPEHMSQQQFITDLKEKLKETEITSDQEYNGLTSLGLKNSEKTVCVFLGIVSVLGLAVMAKVISMLMASDEKERPISLAVPGNSGHEAAAANASVVAQPVRQPGTGQARNEQPPGLQPMFLHIDGQLLLNDQRNNGAAAVAPLAPPA